MLKVIKPGVFSSIQDLGRHGHRHLGVSQSGVLDPIALKAGNALLGNIETAACIEITVGLAEFEFTQPCNFAITGGNLNAKLNSKALYPGWRYHARTGDIIKFTSHPDSLRAYLCVENGFDVPKVMNSRSTDCQAKFGGFEGNPLQKDDCIPFSKSLAPCSELAVKPSDYTNVVRVLKGPHCDILPEDYLLQLLSQTWTVSDLSNRMGVRLEHSSLLTHQESIDSQGVHPGVIQLPPTGTPIVLLNDCQTTGGYPIIASVIQADLRHFSQLAPTKTCRFELVEFDVANTALQKQEQKITRFKIAKQQLENKK
ncbi:allophanate hydrolase [Pseudoalteromonas phenolica]|uniref:5-oxoprolinase subunit C family protein n=1 Tax=Pseudoalteromonas phenolica TaxID=161398 RepID=UPI00110A137A|nr:biotin-dependent carboxyltransferase family protein [Pseudoalteromonas phenolica]TMN86541.1 allophanate hydrolase [Pseudoalteromonas phenolica]